MDLKAKVGDRYKAGRMFPNLSQTDVVIEIVEVTRTSMMADLMVCGIFMGIARYKEYEDGSSRWKFEG